MLGAHILKNAGFAASVEDGLGVLEEKLASGEGLAKLAEMIAAQGGDARVAYDTSLLPKAEKQIDVPAAQSGYVASITTSDIGEAAKLLGAGRTRKEDPIDPAVGIVMKNRIGDFVAEGEAICTLHVNPASNVEAARALIARAVRLSEEPVAEPKLIHSVVE